MLPQLSRVFMLAVAGSTCARAFTPAVRPAARRLRAFAPTARSMSSAPAPFGLVVTVEIKEDRIDDFLTAMKVDVEGSRTEAGCLRFDLLRDQADPNTFVFYEVYKDADAVAVHKATPHFAVWSEFKATGGVVSQTAMKMDAIDWSGE